MVKEPQDPKEAMMLYRAMSHFQNNPEIRPMAIWFRTELKRLDKANRKEPIDANFRQRQGSCQVLEKIIKMVESSRERESECEKQAIKLQIKGGTKKNGTKTLF
jgi:hypothetical protein